MGFVYMITNTVNQKCYIGISIHEPEDGRIKKHLSGHGNRILANAVKKYSSDAFTYEILEENVFPALLPDLEVVYIAKFDTVRPNGYNLTYGGEGAGNPSAETRQKMSQAHKGKSLSMETRQKMSQARIGKNNPNYGKIHSTETRKKISQAKKGKSLSMETRQKMSQANSGKNNPNYGKSPSTETRQKMSEAKKGKPLSMETREKLSKSLRGKPVSAETRKKLSEANRGKKHVPHSLETRQKLSEANSGKNNPNYGKSPSTETRQKMSEAKKGKPAKNRGSNYEPAHTLFCSLPKTVPLSEKRKILRERFPDVSHHRIWNWVKQWESEKQSQRLP